MKPLCPAALLITIPLFLLGCSEPEHLRIASFNILSSQFKFDMGLGPEVEDPEKKRALQVSYLDSLNPDLLLLQEAEPLYGQVDYIAKTSPELKPLKASNGLAILYNHNNLTLLKQGYVSTLSVQFATLKHKRSGRLLHAMNVHLGGGEGSLQSLRAIADWASHQWDMGSESIFIAGDMNTNLTGQHYDSLRSEYPIFADPNRDKLTQQGGWLIDWILLNKGFDVIDSQWDKPRVSSRHISDHPIVWADVALKSFDEPFEPSPKPARDSSADSEKAPLRRKPPTGLPTKEFTFTGNNYFNFQDNTKIIQAQSYSVSFWFRADTDINLLGQNYLVSNQGYPFGWEFEIRAGVPYFEARVQDSGSGRASGVRVKGTTRIRPEVWYHVLISVAEDEARIYLDGLLEGRTALPGGFHYHDENPGLFLGTRWDLRNLFKGEIRQLAFFEAIITKQELEKYLHARDHIWNSDLPRLTVEDRKQVLLP